MDKSVKEIKTVINRLFFFFIFSQIYKFLFKLFSFYITRNEDEKYN